MSKFITYQKEKLPLRINFAVLRDFEKETKKSLMGLKENEELTLEEMEALFYVAYLAGCRAANQDPKYSREDIAAVLDDVFLCFVQMVPVLIEEFFKPQNSTKPTKKAK